MSRSGLPALKRTGWLDSSSPSPAACGWVEPVSCRFTASGPQPVARSRSPAAGRPLHVAGCTSPAAMPVRPAAWRGMIGAV